jgi:hypothetical protein
MVSSPSAQGDDEEAFDCTFSMVRCQRAGWSKLLKVKKIFTRRRQTGPDSHGSRETGAGLVIVSNFEQSVHDVPVTVPIVAGVREEAWRFTRRVTDQHAFWPQPTRLPESTAATAPLVVCIRVRKSGKTGGR